jgi:hypothetical protein
MQSLGRGYAYTNYSRTFTRANVREYRANFGGTNINGAYNTSFFHLPSLFGYGSLGYCKLLLSNGSPSARAPGVNYAAINAILIFFINAGFLQPVDLAIVMNEWSSVVA